jgi:hypothetical protein
VTVQLGLPRGPLNDLREQRRAALAMMNSLAADVKGTAYG